MPGPDLHSKASVAIKVPSVQRRRTIIKVVLRSNTRTQPAIIFTRNIRGQPMKRADQFLSKEIAAIMKPDAIAYFEAEHVGGIWHIGERIPNCGW